MSDTFISVHSINAILTALQEQGVLTADHLEGALVRESNNGLGWHHLRSRAADDPFNVARWMAHDEMDRIFDRAPIVVRWILDNLDAFEALPMDHAEFICGLMDEERFPYPMFTCGAAISARIALEFARHPDVFRFLSETERERRLAALDGRFDDRI